MQNADTNYKEHQQLQNCMHTATTKCKGHDQANTATINYNRPEVKAIHDWSDEENVNKSQPLQQAISETKMLQISATSTRLENEPECICNQQPQNQDSSVQLEFLKNQSMPQ